MIHHREQTTTPGTSWSTLCEQCVDLLRPMTLWTLKGCETRTTVYCSYLRKLKTLSICRCHYKRSNNLLSYFTTLSVGPVRVELTLDLPHDSPVLNQLSHRCMVVHFLQPGQSTKLTLLKRGTIMGKKRFFKNSPYLRYQQFCHIN